MMNLQRKFVHCWEFVRLTQSYDIIKHIYLSYSRLPDANF